MQIRACSPRLPGLRLPIHGVEFQNEFASFEESQGIFIWNRQSSLQLSFHEINVPRWQDLVLVEILAFVRQVHTLNKSIPRRKFV